MTVAGFELIDAYDETMPKRAMLILVALSTVSVLGGVALGAPRLLARLTEPPGRPPCSAAEEAFAETLAADPMVNEAPAGMEKVWAHHAQPCVSIQASDWYGGAQTAWGYSASLAPSEGDIWSFYAERAAQQGWESIDENGMGHTDGAASWVKAGDGTDVWFSVSKGQLDGRPVYWATLSYFRGRRG